jgi:hypothetical protein
MNEEMNKPQSGMDAGKAMGLCRCPHHLTWPIVIVAVGIIMLLSALGLLGEHGLSVAFSLLVIATGVLLAARRSCRCCGKDGRCCKNGKCSTC